MYVQCAFAWSLLTHFLKSELILNTHAIITDMRQDVSKIREDTGSRNWVVSDV